MDDLKRAFESLGFGNVKTVLASGNVLFEAQRTSATLLAKTIEQKLKQRFGSDIGVIVRTLKELERLAESNPFRGIAVTPQTRLYVTFLSEEPTSRLKIPYATPDKAFRILRVTTSEVSSLLTLSPDHGTVDLMQIIEKEFGRKVTTRNWNTVLRLLQATK